MAKIVRRRLLSYLYLDDDTSTKQMHGKAVMLLVRAGCHACIWMTLRYKRQNSWGDGDTVV